MAMIYQPQLIFNVREALGGAVVKAGILAAADFASEANKPWAYYAGAFFGGAAMATGIVGAATTLYIIGDTMDFYLFKSPDGSDVRMFLDGVQVSSLDTYAATSVWEFVQNTFLGGGGVHRVDFVNFAASTASGATGTAWMALGPVTVNGGGEFVYSGESVDMAFDTVVFRTQDGDIDSDYGAIPFYIPSGFTKAEIQTWASALAVKLDAALNTKIVVMEVTLALTVPGGLKAVPVVNSQNERGGLLSFDTSGPWKDSVRLPGILTALMAADAVSVGDAKITDIVTIMTTQTTAANIRPVTRNEFNWEALVGGKRSQRK